MIRVRQRTSSIGEIIVRIWPVPEGHRSVFTGGVKTHHRSIELVDFIGAGMLGVGQKLHPRQKATDGVVATVLADGSIEVRGQAFATPSGAAGAITGSPTNGWWYFLRDPESFQSSLSSLRDEYIQQFEIDMGDDEQLSAIPGAGITGHRFPRDDVEHTCTGRCGRSLPSNKFPTVSGEPWRLSECRECRDRRTSSG